MTSSKSSYPTKGPPLNTIILGIRTSTDESCGDTIYNYQGNRLQRAHFLIHIFPPKSYIFGEY